MTLNDVILDPSLAPKISEAMMNPSKGLGGKDTTGGAVGWIAPIVKLFQGEEKPVPSSYSVAPTHGTLRTNSHGLGHGLSATTQRSTSRIAPKLSPALSASTTTVNVEFQSGSAGRAITSTHSAYSSSNDVVNHGGQQTSEEETRAKTSASVMGIFAGAPKPASPQDPWIFIPKASRKPPSPLSQVASQNFETGTEGGTLTVGRNTLKVNAQLSRVVDAVIDAQSPTVAAASPDYQATLAHRGLRHRVFSDSSIHTTLLNHAEGGPGQNGEQKSAESRQADQESTSSGIWGSLEKKVMAFRSVSTSFGSLSRGITPKPTAPRLSVIPPSRSSTASDTMNTPGAPSRMREPINPKNRAQEDSDSDDLGGPAISRGPFFPIAGARMNAETWPGNEQYVGSITQEWLTARERVHGARGF